MSVPIADHNNRVENAKTLFCSVLAAKLKRTFKMAIDRQCESKSEGIKGSSIKSTIINVNKNKMAEATGWATSAMRLTN